MLRTNTDGFEPATEGSAVCADFEPQARAREYADEDDPDDAKERAMDPGIHCNSVVTESVWSNPYPVDAAFLIEKYRGPIADFQHAIREKTKLS